MHGGRRSAGLSLSGGRDVHERERYAVTRGGASNPLVIWRLLDGKPGHERQSLGLCNALARRLTVERHDLRLSAVSKGAQLWQLLTGRFPLGRDLPRPDLVIGSGHRAHLALLAAVKVYGGRSLVIMKPSLPRYWFDLCVVPVHDGLDGDGVFVTEGAMNDVWIERTGRPEQALLLLGGPSDHFKWDDDRVLEQVRQLAEGSRAQRWRVSDSRRTPEGFLDRVRALGLANLEVTDWRSVGADWLPQQLASSDPVWVSQDSVSMIYESLTAGARVGLLELAPSKESRVAAGVQRLVEQRRVTRFSEWVLDQRLVTACSTFNEAERCAQWMVERWLKND